MTTLDPEFPRRLRALLVEAIRPLPSRVAVAASGGVSSTSLVLAAVEAGKDVTVASFTLADRESRDMRAARSNAEALGLPFERVNLSTDLDILDGDVRDIIAFRSALGFKTSKAATECAWPFRHLVKRLAAREIPALVVGSGDDIPFGLYKQAILNFRSPKEAFDGWRGRAFAHPDAAQAWTISVLASDAGIVTAAPFRLPGVMAPFMDYEWDALNKPRQKEPLRRAFPELEGLRVYLGTNLQLGDSGIAALFEGLSPRYGGLSPTRIYNRIAREMAFDDKGL